MINKDVNPDFQAISKTFPLILASASPRRKSLLEQVGIPFRSLPANMDESGFEGEPASVVRLLAEKKAKSACPDAGESWILGADTIVLLGETIFGKPRDSDDARFMLRLLSGKEHEVVTGFCLIDPSGEPVHIEHISTLVRVKTLSDQEINAYIATGEPFGKAGSYAIQGIGSFLVEGINGSYTNVVGLPVCALIKTLLVSGALEEFPLTALDVE
ncbi:MAG: septum formation protein Maf [Deltaproteobacteria bacterium]|nr:septum formation protein Maf [Deltaproteobacteria bacterium]